MKKHFFYIFCLCAATAVILSVTANPLHKTVNIDSFTLIDHKPSIRPDYTGTVIPPNIAPLNFAIKEKGVAFLVKIYCDNEESVDVFSKDGRMFIPIKEWSSLLNNNRGKTLSFDIYVKDENNNWKKFETIENIIAQENIDPYLAYRFIKPLYSWWKSIGIYQRNLSNFDRDTILHGKSFGEGCLNCHSFPANRPDIMTIGYRSPIYSSATVLADNGKVSKVGAKWGYTAWHPSGKVAVYSISKVRQFFHKSRIETRDVVDLDAALAYYLVDKQEVKTSPALAEIDRLETYPAWSPDGKWLYFCSAPIPWEDRDKIPPDNFDKVKYDLRRISYDIEKDIWGQPETILSAEETGLSILLPRVSPDGRFVVFSMCQYGCFPVYMPSSDLYIMDLTTGSYRELTVLNSEYSESWHSFSSNSRWLAFSSKKRDGLFTRTYFSYIDNEGNAHKPFILPQQDPTYYDSLYKTYSVPELITGPVAVSSRSLAQAIRSDKEISVDMPITGATPKTESSEPWEQGRE